MSNDARRPKGCVYSSYWVQLSLDRRKLLIYILKKMTSFLNIS